MTLKNKRKRWGKIWSMPSEKFRQIVSSSSSFVEMLSYFNFATKGSNYRTLLKRIEEEDLDISHIPRGPYASRGRVFKKPHPRIPLKEVLVKNSTYDRRALKTRIMNKGLIENKCNICGLLPMWEEKKLVLVLDHINGDGKDNRLENLRLLCPNCNSQQPTFCGRNIKNRETYFCHKCGNSITKYSKTGLCPSCYKKSTRKVERPPYKQLKQEIKELGYCGTGRKYGVSNTAIRKWVKIYEKQMNKGDNHCQEQITG